MSATGTGRCRSCVLAVELANRERLHLPRRNLRLGFGFPLAHFLLVCAADERPDDVEVITLLQLVGHVFREAVPHISYVEYDTERR